MDTGQRRSGGEGTQVNAGGERTQVRKRRNTGQAGGERTQVRQVENEHRSGRWRTNTGQRRKSQADQNSDMSQAAAGPTVYEICTTNTLV